MRVARVQEPAPSGVRPVLDHLADELDAEPAAAVLGQHVDVGEVGDATRRRRPPGRSRPGAAVVVEADDPLRLADEPLDRLARPPLRPVRLGQERVDRVDVDPRGIVVELVPAVELSDHPARSVRSRKPPCSSYEDGDHREHVARPALGQAGRRRVGERRCAGAPSIPASPSAESASAPALQAAQTVPPARAE